MKINILSIGKFRNNPQKVIFDEYLCRIGWNLLLKEIEVKESFKGNKLKDREGQLIIDNIANFSRVILLDEAGQNFTSRQIAQMIVDCQNQSYHNLVFIIGGVCGVSKSVIDRADTILSFGKITMPHMMVRSILIEQIYRSYTITNNHPYHKD